MNAFVNSGYWRKSSTISRTNLGHKLGAQKLGCNEKLILGQVKTWQASLTGSIQSLKFRRATFANTVCVDR